ncbi:contractile injection system protein, VgrG/Pvc8 family [Chitinivorax sp. B]|uniref:phage late control D family protein n=1 Tax=Chitinivorax sp. B TaxID=2502235 RepID=UPI0010F5EA32|nr:contractile injection system protein, VgrG/Pvc8 family [Chitinivorax sp. B]
MPDDLLYTATPTFMVDSQRQPSLARDLLRLEVVEDCWGMKRLMARFTAWGQQASGGSAETELYWDGQIFDFGKSLEVAIGSPSSARTVFKGLITALEADYREGNEPQLVLYAEDALLKLRLKHRYKTWEDVSDADMVQQIASEHGLTASADASGPTYKVVQQWNQSDLAFLRERARLINAELWLEGDTLHFAQRDQRAGTEVTLVNGNHLIKLEIRADLAHQRSEAHVAGYDINARDLIDESAAAGELSGETGSGKSGLSILEQAIGSYPVFRNREVPLVSAEATDWAKAELKRRARRFVCARGITRGTPDLSVGSRITLDRIAKPFAGGGYIATKVLHTYDLIDGHRTLFEAERPMVNNP